MIVTAEWETANASRYLQQMCKHFAHKVPTEWTPTHGVAAMPHGRCEMTAVGNTLRIELEPNDASRLPLLAKVVEVHLQRFAWKEPDFSLEWQRDGAPLDALMSKLREMPDPHGSRPD